MFKQQEIHESALDSRSLEDIYKEVQDVYLSNNKPWIIGYSGGKDSTAILQIVWYALSKLSRKKLIKPIYVISSDTLVENPIILDRTKESLHKINSAAKKAKLPLTAELLKPIISDTFWVNLIGRGYPAPYHSFRWCTDRLKIRTSSSFILEKANEFGEAITVLGSRLAESETRARSINKKERRIEGSILSRHPNLIGVRVYYPIKYFTTDDVWSYLLQTPNPWGDENQDLAAIYKGANAGECPFVVDDTTPPCGNSRFGCWVCTLVERDKSMEALIDKGEDWLLPLLEIRNKLVETQDPDSKYIYREPKRRNGRIDFKRDGSSISYGPYKTEFRKELLRDVLIAEKKMKEMNPAFSGRLILPEELHEIRRIWKNEWDWENSISRIYKEITSEELEWIQEDFGEFGEVEYKLLLKVSEKYDVPYELVSKLLSVEHQLQGMFRRSSVYGRIDAVLGEEWRSLDEVLAGNKIHLTKNDS